VLTYFYVNLFLSRCKARVCFLVSTISIDHRQVNLIEFDAYGKNEQIHSENKYTELNSHCGNYPVQAFQFNFYPGKKIEKEKIEDVTRTLL
jgi:hypothetical protein